MMQELLARPTVVFGICDQCAIGALRARYEAGLRVPEDLALALYAF